MAIEILSYGNKNGPNKAVRKNSIKKIQKPKASRNIFDKSSESIQGAIARNLFKPVSKTVSKLGGMPADILNLLSDITQQKQDTAPDASLFTKIQDWLSDPSLPRAPFGESLTSKGIETGLTKPVGEYLFGRGSQEKQPGFLEGIIDRAAEWVPYTIGPAALKGVKGLYPLLGGLGTNLLQGIAGETAKEFGAGETTQGIAEIATGFGAPLLGKTLFKATPKNIAKETFSGLSKERNKAWTDLEKVAASSGKISSNEINNSLLKTKKILSNRIAPENLTGSMNLVDEIIKDVGESKISPSKLVNARLKISNAYNKSVAAGTDGILGELKGNIDEILGKSLGKAQVKALDISKTVREFKNSEAYLKYVAENKDKVSNDSLKSLLQSPVAYGSALGIALKNPALIIGALGFGVYKNIAPLLKNPATRKELIKVIGKTSAEAAVKTKIKTIQDRRKGKNSPKGIEILSYGSSQ